MAGRGSLKKIIKTVVNISYILRHKRTKFNFVLGFASDHTAGAYSAPPDPQNPYLNLMGPTSKG